jgi:hypothetical protein
VHQNDDAVLGAVEHKISTEEKEEHLQSPLSSQEEDDNKPNHVVLQLSQGRSGSTVVSCKFYVYVCKCNLVNWCACYGVFLLSVVFAVAQF